MKESMARKSFDNVTCLIIALKDIYSNDNLIVDKVPKNHHIKSMK